MGCAQRLTEAFKGQDLDFWIDWEGIPPIVDWWNEIESGIEKAGIFLFLVSPASIQSKVCRQEIDHVIKNGKRLIPVVVREVNAEEVSSVLSHLNWIFLRENDDFDTAFTKNDIMLWDWQNPGGCRLFRKLTGHTAGVTSIEFSPDGRYLLSASGNGTAKLWKTDTWTVFKTLIGHEGAVLYSAFSPDSSLIVTGGADRTIRLWNMEYEITMQKACSLLQRDLSAEELKQYGIPDTGSTCPQWPLEEVTNVPNSFQE